MQAVIFIGIPAAGKSSFYKERFFRTHIRLNLDMLKTKYREKMLMETCLLTQQAFVSDNTNVTRQRRATLIEPAQNAQFQIIGYYFQSVVADCLARNERREGAERIPDGGILGLASRLELPSYDEGFDQLYYVQLTEQGFVVNEWQA